MANGYRIKIVVYDNISSTPDNPLLKADEPAYSPADTALTVNNLYRRLRRLIETGS
jgi:hypothetical protein